MNVCKFGVFDNLSILFGNWSMGFCYKMLYNCSWWFNLIKLVICEKSKILGLERIRIGVFVQFGLNWQNWLVWLIDLVITNCYLSCIMINLVKLLDFLNWVFKFWGFLCNLYAQANFVILNLNWTYSHYIKACIMYW